MIILLLLWPTLCSNGQAITFYSCDLFINYLLFVFRALIVEAAKNAAPRHLCQDVEMWCNFYNADQRGPIYILYILRGENLQILGWFFAEFGTFKPYNFGTTHESADLKQQPETTYTAEYLRKIWCTSAQWLLGTMHFCNSLKSQNCQNRNISPLSAAPSSELHQIFMDASHMSRTEFHQV